MVKKKILLFVDWYGPGYKAGGPIRSCVNFVRNMREDYEVYVFTSDRDLRATAPYENIQADEWIVAQEGVKAFYCSPEQRNWRTIRRQFDLLKPDFIYLNSMFSSKYMILPLLIRRLQERKTAVVLSPRGMLRDTALQFKPLKKKMFLHAFRWFGFQRGIHFHAADETERQDVHRHFGAEASVTQVPNFPGVLSEGLQIIEKKTGELSMIFIGRVHPIKNLDYLLHVLKGVRSRVRLTIIGSLEETGFWSACQEIIATLPENIRVEYGGEMQNHELPAITARHHIFVLPTKGENFGHAIFEALSLGKPVLISDQTPWRNLQAEKAGWDLALDRPDLFRQTIEQAAAFHQEEYDTWCRGAWAFVQDYIGQLNLKDEYVKLFS